MIFSNPVRGVIHGPRWKRPSGNYEPRLSRGFSSMHDGLDVSFGRVGDPIVAAASGRAYFVGRDAEGALFVAINHRDPFRTLYGHLKDATVKPGEDVQKGDVIGHCGYSGYVIPAGPPGAHVHFEVFKDNTARVDPWPLLEQNVKVRLKNDDGIRIRRSPFTEAGVYASTKGGRIIRDSDNADLGASGSWRAWDGSVAGGSYVIDGQPGSRWDKAWIGSAWRFIASPLAVRSAD